ncbi:G-type lectin S-receptor-like serine/threonine-protein kinase At4g27290 isoform X2 [Humulus lupulus]|uniref:G-type lectin S-receptor-like serine/threonine-protein kinase At4g27290 isoform X2 n=1 Tax=Humulus lupulus TaxID=3486 RepID=UPI002B40A72D|nr:G-type lectin S-receptor-like serine/threonine-protein kinase At4g27290 isoform X2 [Humulus lupulus]
MAIHTFKLVILLSLVVDSISSFQSISENRSLVSKEGSFELGFFSPGSSKNRYLGIWYKNIPIQTVVWVANRCSPINDSSGLLRIDNTTGNLELLYQNKSVVWSAILSKRAKKPKVELLDSGNLVITEEEDLNQENYLWQSFDYPSDTLLSGMKLGWDLRSGLNRRLSAWKSWDDPCSSNFTWGIEFDEQLHSLPQAIIRKGSVEFFRSGPWNGLSLGALESTPDMKRLSNFEFVYNENEVYYTYNLKNKSLILIMVLNLTTNSRRGWTWIESKKIWNPYFTSPTDLCDNYGHCGANANCNMSNSPICQCLSGFKPKSPEEWDSMDWSQGCVRENPSSCQMDKPKGEFVKISSLKLPDAKHSCGNRSMNLNECKAKCLSNCSCMAYSNSDIRGQDSGCALWFGDLLDIRVYNSGGQDLYIRMLDSEPGKFNNKVRTAVIVVAVVGSVSGMILLGFFLHRRRGLKERSEKMYQNGGEEEDFELPLFTFSTLATVTDNFSEKNMLGEGGFGPVFRGKLKDGLEIAIKRLSMSSGQGVNEFRNEVKLIAKLQHRNLVKLLGYCIDGEEKLLVYEYLPNKSLDSFIFDQTLSRLLEWPKRFQIICGISRGLLYLHEDSRMRIVHRDLKASNVLLDHEMNPKISDFGIAKTFGGDQTEGNTKRVVGTYGYMAPEYAFAGLFSTKSDVFSFGIVVLEIISGMKSRNFQQENGVNSLIGHAWTLLKEGRSMELINEWLRDSYDNLQQVLHCIHVGLLCVQQSPMDRPTMSTVIFMLGRENEVLPQPKPPGYYFMVETYSQEPNHSFNILHTYTSTNSMTLTFGGR